MTDPAAAGVRPQPTPETWNFHPQGDGSVVVEIMSVTGTHYSFLTGSDARNMGAQLIRAAQTASSGLIVPAPGTQLPPRPTPNGNAPT